jgi:hypothetical protein
MPPIQQWLVLFWSKLHEMLLLLDKFLEHQIFPVGYTGKIGDMTQEGSLLILASVLCDEEVGHVGGLCRIMGLVATSATCHFTSPLFDFLPSFGRN